MRHSLLAEPRKWAKMSFWNESMSSCRFIRSMIVSKLSGTRRFQVSVILMCERVGKDCGLTLRSGRRCP